MTPAFPDELSRLWRVDVAGDLSIDSTRTFYIEAGAERHARRRVTAVVAALECVEREDVDHRVLSVQHARACVEQGTHPNVLARIFEVRSEDGESRRVAQPVFLLARPSTLCGLWALAGEGELGPVLRSV